MSQASATVEPAVRFRSVTKAFRLVHQRPLLAREVLRRLLARPQEVTQHLALRDVSFEVPRGATVGVIGSNGSGKSTLLGLIAGISYPTRGLVEVHGTVGPLLSLGAGFHPVLTGRENIVLNGSLLGMSREELEPQIESIIDYSELRKFIDSPTSAYSTGMVARLGFAVLAHMKPDILLIDETLSVGDARFRQKCQRTIQDFFEDGTTVLLVSHSTTTIKSICRQVLWIEEGACRGLGPADEMIARYEEHVAASS